MKAEDLIIGEFYIYNRKNANANNPYINYKQNNIYQYLGYYNETFPYQFKTIMRGNTVIPIYPWKLSIPGGIDNVRQSFVDDLEPLEQLI